MMRNGLLLLLLTVWLGSGCESEVEAELPPVPQDPATVANNTPFPWPSFDEAIAAGLSEGKPILIDIYAPWCGWCARMQEEVYGNVTLASYVQQNFAYGRLNLDDTTTMHEFQGHVLTSANLGYALGASGTPTTVFLDPKGTFIDKVPGYQPLERFGPVLQHIATGAYLEGVDVSQEEVSP